MSTLERLERALAAVAYAITLDGPVYAPVLERLEREIAALRAGEDTVSRARRYVGALQLSTPPERAITERRRRHAG